MTKMSEPVRLLFLLAVLLAGTGSVLTAGEDRPVQEKPPTLELPQDVQDIVTAARDKYIQSLKVEVRPQGLEKVSAIPGGNLFTRIESAVFERAKGELAYAAFMELQAHADLALQERFLPNSLATMGSAESIRGTLFASVLAKAVRADAKQFPKNLERYFALIPEQTRLQRIISAIATAAVPTGDRDVVGGLVGLWKIKKELGTPYGKVLDPKTPDDYAELAERVLVIIGITAAVYADFANGSDEEILKVTASIVVEKYLSDFAVEKVKRELLETIAAIRFLHQTIKELVATKEHPTKEMALVLNDKISVVFESFNALADHVVEINGGSQEVRATISKKTESVHQMVRNAVDCYAALVSQRFLDAVANATIVANHYFVLIDQEKPGAVASFLSWATVGAGLAQAEDQESFNAILDSVSDPIGSYRKLRIGGGAYFSVKAYLGGVVGQESIRNDGDDERKGTYTGLFLPVGLELGLTTGCAVISSIGVMVSPIDLGSITATRLDAKTASEDPHFRDVFAPGVYVAFGLSRNWPISIGVGYQYAPGQRRDATTGATLSANRVLGFLAVDVPLLSKKWGF